MARVFISHAGTDAAFSEQVRRWLLEAGHDIFLDQDRDDGILPGEEWEKRLYRELSKADAVVCVVTQSYLTSVWCAAEIGAARALGAELLPVRFSSDGARHTLLKPLHGLDAAKDPDEARERLLSRLSVIDGGGGRGWPDDRSPYPGLRPFDLGDHRVFFGRTREITQISERLRSPERATPTIFTVVGPSGCGKSSLVRAGVIPRIADGNDWIPIPPIVPGTDPLGNLTRALAAVKRERRIAFDVTSLREDILAKGLQRVATDFLVAAEADSQCKLLVVIDQFEELLTQTEPDVRAEFAEVLGPALGGPIQVLATLRPEFLDSVVKDPHLYKLALRIRQVRPLDADALRAVIEKPAKVAGFSFDEDLVSRLVTDTGDGTALPLLAYTLEQLSEGVVRGGRLTQQRYDEIGGVRGALRRQADAALQEACGNAKVAPEQVVSRLLSLVTIDEAGRPAKRTGALDEFSTATVELEPFISRRLLTTYAEGDRTYVTVAHEAFLVNWPPLADEIDKQAAALRARRVVENAANDWVAGGRDTGGLLIGRQLAKATVDTGAEMQAATDAEDGAAAPPKRLRFLSSWRTPRTLVTQVQLNDTAREFLETSIRTDQAQRRRRTLQVAASVVILTVAAVAAVAAPIGIMNARNDAQNIARNATATRLQQEATDMLSQSKPGNDVRALYELLAANSLDSATTQGAMLNAVLQRLSTTRIVDTGSSVVDVALNADGHLMATAGVDGNVQLWDANSGRPIGAASRVALNNLRRIASIAFSSTGLRVATISKYNDVEVWNVDSGSSVGRTQSGESGRLEAAALSADGLRMAAGSSDGTVLVQNVDTGELVNSLDHGARVLAVAFSQDRHRIATGGADNTVQVWNADTGQHLATVRDTASVRSLALDRQGNSLAIGGADNTVQLWNTVTGKPSGAPLTGHADWVQAVSFSADGAHLTTGSADRTVRLWDLDAGLPVKVNTGGTLAGVVLSADGRRAATGGADGALRLWNIESGEPVAVSSDMVQVSTAAFTPDGRFLAAGSSNGAVRLWNTETGQEAFALKDSGAPVGSVAFSGDGRLLASASEDKKLQIWDVGKRQLVRELTGTGYVWGLALNSDGTRLATGGRGDVRLWDTNTGQPRSDSPSDDTPADGDDLVRVVAFSPDGHYVAGAGDGQTVVVWNATTGQAVRSFEMGHHQLISGLAYSPDGKLLATGSADHTARLWDAATGLAVGAPLTGHTDAVQSVAFSPDGKRLMTASIDKTIRAWPAVATPEMLCDKLTKDISQAQWQEWISSDPNIGYVPLCEPSS